MRITLMFIASAILFTGFRLYAGEHLTRKKIDDRTGEEIVELVRISIAAAIKERPPRFKLSRHLTSAANGVHIVLFKDRKILAETCASQASLAGNIRLSSSRLAALIAEEDFSKLTLLVTVLLKETPLGITGITPLRLWRHTALGIDGLRVSYQGHEAFLPPVTPILRGWSPEDVLTDLARQVFPDATEKTKPEQIRMVATDKAFTVTRVPGVSLLSIPGQKKVIRLFRMGRLVPPSDVTRESIAEALKRATNWYAVHEKGKGGFPYQYNVVTGEYSKRDMLLRRMMNLAAMGALWQHNKDAALRDRAIRALGVLMSSCYIENPKEGFGYLQEKNSGSLGLAASGLLAISNLKAGEKNPVFKTRAERLVVFLSKTMRHSDGRYEISYPSFTGGVNIDYYPGEAQLALMTHAGRVNDAKLIEHCLISMRYYRNYFWKTMHTPFIPWHTQACYLLYTSTRRQEVADFVFRMNALLVTTQQILPEDGIILPEDERGRFFNPKKRSRGYPHVSSTGVYLEGLADAFALARLLRDQKYIQQYRLAIIWGVRNLLQLQVKDEADTFYMPEPKLALGGFRTRPENPRVRIDNQQHCVAALVKVIKVFKDEDYKVAAGLGWE